MGASASAQNSTISLNPVDSKKKSENIDQFLQNEKEKATRSIKLLLLGQSGSGKSTLTKQIRILYDHDFLETERYLFRSIVRQNILEVLMKFKSCIDEIQIDVPRQFTDMFVELSNITECNVDNLIARYSSSITRFLSSECYNLCMGRRWDFDLPSSTEYFADNADRILDYSYVPTNEDILHARVNTNGLHETSFQFKGFEFTVFDVGGQKTDPRKWIHYFDNVSAMIYTVDISCYDNTDTDPVHGTQNRLMQSLQVFKSVISHQVFNRTTIILFLNKTDIFRSKIKHISLHSTFPEYNGTDFDFKESSRYLQLLFTERNFDSREFYSHFTTATNSSNIRTLFDDVISIILQQGMSKTQLY